MTGRLDGQRTVVTGASRGIGRAIAERYAAEGASVALAARSVDQLEAVADGIDGETLVVDCDVRDRASVDAMIDQVGNTFGGIDVVVNNAGVIGRSEMVDVPESEMDWVVDVNLKGQMRVARAALPALIDSSGVLINVSSQLGTVGVPGTPVYCATKGGINNLSRQLAVEYAEEGVRVNALAPGVVLTTMNEAAARDPAWIERKRSKIPLDRLGEPDEIAGPAVFLASDDAGYVTGHVLVVDGGYTAE